MEEQIRRARALAESGQKEEARRVLRSLLNSDRTIGPAWAMLAHLETDATKRDGYLRKTISAAEINDTPHNQQAAKWAKDTLEGYQAVASQAAQPPRKKGGLGIILALLIFAFVCVIVVIQGGLLAAGDGGGYEPSSSRSTDHTVMYEVTGGTTNGVGVTYRTDQGGTEQGDYNLPFRKTYYNFLYGDFVYISAQNNGRYGTVTCTIYVDGEAVLTSTSSGAYKIATCSGSVGD